RRASAVAGGLGVGAFGRNRDVDWWRHAIEIDRKVLAERHHSLGLAEGYEIRCHSPHRGPHHGRGGLQIINEICRGKVCADGHEVGHSPAYVSRCRQCWSGDTEPRFASADSCERYRSNIYFLLPAQYWALDTAPLFQGRNNCTERRRGLAG